jgi:phenylalanyl-tRNA synthetase beta chain
MVSIEVKDSNRPDVWSVEGIARVLRGQLGLRKAGEVRVAGRSSLRVIIDKRVRPIRPYISAAIVKGLRPTEDSLKSWINLQDKLDQTYGRKRKKASIGFYQAELIASPLSYTVSDPDGLSFAPLGSETKSTLRDILAHHPKGSEYGEIISGFHEWPILIDGKERVLSLPPVINSNDLGKITTKTRNILVEVTGTNSETVHNTLKIVLGSLAMRGGRIYSCLETYPYGSPKRIVSPDLKPTSTKLSLSSVNKLLGATLSPRDASKLAEKAGYKIRNVSRDFLNLEIPSYRIDIMHPVDIIEDIAIASNLNDLKPEWPNIWTIGELSKQTTDAEALAEIMIGLGFQEILTYILTSPDVVSGKMQIENDSNVMLANPKMTTHTVLRNWLLPSLLEFLSQNTHVDYPQKVFEIGPVINRGDSSSHPIQEDRKIAAVTIHATAGFTEIRSSLDALIKSVGHEFQIRPGEHPSFLPGRCGEVVSAGREIGIIGEINPSVLQSFGLNLPAAGFELDMPRELNKAHVLPAPEGPAN